MAESGWAAKIRKDREAAEERAASEQKARSDSRQNYETKAEDFWGRVVAALKSGIAEFNDEGGLAQKVQFEGGQNNCSAVQSGVGALQLGIDHGTQRVTVTDRLMRPDGRRDHTQHYDVISSKADLTIADGKTPEQFIEGQLEFFCRRISGIR
jgi:hypothetical protein